MSTPSNASVAKEKTNSLCNGDEVVHPGDVGRPLDVGQLLARLLHAGVQVPDDGLGAQYRLAVQLEHEAQHAVGRGVLRAHVDDHRLVVAALEVDVPGVDVVALGQAQHGAHLAAQVGRIGRVAGQQFLGALGGLGPQHGLLDPDPLLVLDLIGARLVVVPVHIAMPVLVLGRARARRSWSLIGDRGLFELHRYPPDAVVLAQGVAFPVLGHQDPGQVRMTFEDDPHHVVGLALHGVDAGVTVHQARHDRVRFGHLHPDAHPLAQAQREQVDHDLEALRFHAVGQRPPRVRQVVHRAEVGARLEAAEPEGLDHLGVAVAVREGQLVHQAVGQARHVGQDGRRRRRRGLCRTRVAHRGVATRTALGTVGTQPPVACSPTGMLVPGRRVISPVRIFSCRVKMACSNVSGEGGQPGA